MGVTEQAVGSRGFWTAEDGTIYNLNCKGPLRIAKCANAGFSQYTITFYYHEGTDIESWERESFDFKSSVDEAWEEIREVVMEEGVMENYNYIGPYEMKKLQ